MVNTLTRPTDTGSPQHGAGLRSSRKPSAKVPKKGEWEKRLALALNGETFRRFLLRTVSPNQTHQDNLEAAIANHHNRANE